MHKIPHIWPGFPVSGICLISWPADVIAFGTSNLNSAKHQGRERFLKISLRWFLGWHKYGKVTTDQCNKAQERSFRNHTSPTYLACWLNLQTQCLITWWDYYHQLKKKKKNKTLQIVKVHVGWCIKFTCLFSR